MIIQAVAVGCGLVWGYDKLYRKFFGDNSVKSVESNSIKDAETNDPQHQSQIAPSNINSLQNSTSQQLSIVQSTQNKPEKIETEEIVNKNFALSISAIGAGVAGSLLFTPLLFVSAGISIYTCIPLFKAAKHSIFKEKSLKKIEVLDSVATAVTIISGYYTAAAISCFAYYAAQKIRLKSEYNARKELINIFSDQPSFVWLLKDGAEIALPIESLQSGDTIVVNAGEVVPVDGVVVHGMASVDQHLLTGEFQPSEKVSGDEVLAATVLISGRIHVKVEKTGSQTVVSKIGQILADTSAFSDRIESIGQEIADESVPLTVGISALSLLFVGKTAAIALLCSDFLDSVRVNAPIGMLNFLRIASCEGILIKDGRSLQLLPQIDTVIFDKTGTLTLECPTIGTIHTFNGIDEDTLIRYAASAEYRQTHPVAQTILKEAEKRAIKTPEIDEAYYRVGYGISVKIGDQWIKVGSDRFMDSEGITVPENFEKVKTEIMAKGCSLIYVAAGNLLVGVIEMRPLIRPEIKEVVKALKQKNMSLYIISGDNHNPTKILAESLGIENYFAQVLPEDKANLIEELQKAGRKVCFVGDGINDSIALKRADVSISLRGASTIATDNAQVILMDQSLKKLPALFNISSDFQKNMRNAFYTIGGQSILSIGGVFFLNIGVQAVTIMYVAATLSGAAITMLPLLKLDNKSKDKNRLKL
ncbi:MAG: heavy metal translocating P-type ATPase [Desulfamplus sp.]|nr:heavy metal translocating P-type ATPase [Desulfamplus sp.]